MAPAAVWVLWPYSLPKRTARAHPGWDGCRVGRVPGTGGLPGYRGPLLRIKKEGRPSAPPDLTERCLSDEETALELRIRS